jgi:hypothetical protein
MDHSYASKRMKENNPMKSAGSREKMRRTLVNIGHNPPVRGGNGTGLTVPQSELLLRLQTSGDLSSWIPECVVLTGMNYPRCYKVDIGNPSEKLAVEVDGKSHGLLLRKQQDQKKDVILNGVGWTVLRFSNEDVLANPTLCVQTVLSTISKLRTRIHTSPTES